MFNKSCTVVMPYVPSRWGHEWKYALRSLCRFYPSMKNLVIISDTFPEMLTKGTFDFIQSSHTVDSELRRLASQSELVSEQYIWYSDDYLILNPFEEHDLSRRYLEAVSENDLHLAEGTTDPWQLTVWRAIKLLQQHGLPYNNYTLHCPTLFNKHEVLQTLQQFDSYFARPAGRNSTPHFETIHFNWHYSRSLIEPYPQESRKILFFAESASITLEKCKDYKFMFYNDRCPGHFIASFLNSREPEPCRFELS